MGRLDPIYYTNVISKLLKNSSFDIKSIKEVIEYVKTGFASGQEDQAKDEHGIIHIRPTNMDNDGLLKFDKNIYVPSKLLQTNKNDILIKGEVLFNNTNSQELVGKTTYFDLNEEYFSSNHITRIKTNNLIKSKYLWILLNLYHKYKVFFNSCTNWNNQSGVNNELLKSYKIPIPSKAIQQEIIDIMENAYISKKAKEEQAQKIIDGIDDYLFDKLGISLPEEPKDTIQNRTFKVDFSDIFNNRLDSMYFSQYFKNIHTELEKSTYPIVKLVDICVNIFQGISQNLSNKPNNILLKVKNINKENEIDFKNTEFIEYIPKNKLLKKNDIITPFIGEAIKQYKFSVFTKPDQNLNYCVDNNTGVIRLQKNINSIYVSSFLMTPIGVAMVKQLIGGGGVPFLGANNAKKLLILLPDIEIQNEIAEEVNLRRQKAKQLKNEAQQKLEKAKTEVEGIILGSNYES